MSNAARKLRKRQGIKFEKPAKVGTPIFERAIFWAPVPGAPSTKFAGSTRGRSEKKREKMLKTRFLIA